MVAQYPTPSNIPAEWSNAAVESVMAVVKEAIHDARFLYIVRILSSIEKYIFVSCGSAILITEAF